MNDLTITASHRVEVARRTDEQAVVDALAAAFADDPIFAWCMPDPARRRAALPAFFRLATEATMPHGEVVVTADRAAAALWVPPGAAAVPEEDAERFGAAVAEVVGDDGGRIFTLMALLEEAHPAAPHRFLWFLGARPQAQGSGRGSSLLRQMLTRCDATGTAAYLEATSEDNRRLYERHGFDVVERLVADEAPPLYAMWREPRPLS